MRYFSNLLQGILEKPELVIGEKSITKMWYFLYGYQSAWLSIKGQNSVDDVLFEGFQTWVGKRYRMRMSHNWASVILFMEGGSEYRAFDRAKQLWYQYREEMESLNPQNAKE